MSDKESFNIEDFHEELMNQKLADISEDPEHGGKSDVHSATLNSINTLIGGGMLGKQLDVD